MWSDQIGASLILPSDAEGPDGGKPYIVVGEEVPTEVADLFSAALVFWSGTTKDVTNVVYWALGIANDGDLVFAGLVPNVSGIDSNTGQEYFFYSVQRVFTITRTGNIEYGGLEFKFNATARASGTVLPRIISKRSVFVGTIAAGSWVAFPVNMPIAFDDTNYVVLANAREFAGDNQYGGARFQVGETFPILPNQFGVFVYNPFTSALNCHVSYVATECNY